MAQLLLANPKRRRKSTKSRRKSPARRRTSLATVRTTSVKRYRRNPIRRLRASGLVDQFMGGAVGAGGALAVDFAMSKLPIPDNLRSGAMGSVVKGLVGIGLGMAVSKFGKNKRLGEQMAAGAVTVSLYSFGRATFGAQMGLAGDDGLLGFDNGMLGYQTDFNDNLGWNSPAPVFDTDDLNGYQTTY